MRLARRPMDFRIEVLRGRAVTDPPGVMTDERFLLRAGVALRVSWEERASNLAIREVTLAATLRPKDWEREGMGLGGMVVEVGVYGWSTAEASSTGGELSAGLSSESSDAIRHDVETFLYPARHRRPRFPIILCRFVYICSNAIKHNLGIREAQLIIAKYIRSGRG